MADKVNRLGIMQPYFFPYIGYFQLINAVDRWISFDLVQYIDKGWINRNRILHPDKQKDWLYITVPVQHHKRTDKIGDITINDTIQWRDDLMGKLSAYRKAPYYDATMQLVRECLSYTDDRISEFATRTIMRICQYLDITTPIDVASHMSMSLPEAEHAGQWALNISATLRAAEYINPYSGYEIFDKQEFESKNIKLTFIKPILNPYVQRKGRFIPGLSIIDVLMWNGREKTVEMLNDYELLTYDELRGEE